MHSENLEMKTRAWYRKNWKSIHILPDEVLERVMIQLDYKSRCSVAKTDSRLRKIANNAQNMIKPKNQFFARKSGMSPLAAETYMIKFHKAKETKFPDEHYAQPKVLGAGDFDLLENPL